MEMNSYVTGFVDGEGSFLVSFSKRMKMNTGVEVRPAFTVSQHKRNKNILLSIQKHFSCGTVRFNKHDDTWKYEVRSLRILCKRSFLILINFHYKPQSNWILNGSNWYANL